jgi:hypothetical protein
MSQTIEDFFEILVAGVVMIVLGTALEPLLPFNFAAIGWFLVILVCVASIAILLIAVAQFADSMGR